MNPFPTKIAQLLKQTFNSTCKSGVWLLSFPSGVWLWSQEHRLVVQHTCKLQRSALWFSRHFWASFHLGTCSCFGKLPKQKRSNGKWTGDEWRICWQLENNCRGFSLYPLGGAKEKNPESPKSLIQCWINTQLLNPLGCCTKVVVWASCQQKACGRRRASLLQR